MLEPLRQANPLVLAIPAGGVPVAVEIARAQEAPLEVLVVSKLTLPSNTESGYGAVAFDGGLLLNELMSARTGLSNDDVRRGIKMTSKKVVRRVDTFGTAGIAQRVAGRCAGLMDDGLASGVRLKGNSSG